MFIAVIPAKNEAPSLPKVIANLPADDLDFIVPVLNGCTDNSLSVLEQINCPRLAPLCFIESLGIDVPRSVGAALARLLDAGGVLFLDGDMHGVSAGILRKLIRSVRDGQADLALTNCYPSQFQRPISTQAVYLLKIREELNRHLHLQNKIGHATPSHGPHAISRRLLRTVAPADFAVPPLMLANAARAGLKIGVAAEIPHLHLGSPLRGYDHTRKILETIIGDCLAALNARGGKPGSRNLHGRDYIGYHSERRWDLLEAFISGKLTADCF